jgi:hypothetical protein
MSVFKFLYFFLVKGHRLGIIAGDKEIPDFDFDRAGGRRCGRHHHLFFDRHLFGDDHFLRNHYLFSHDDFLHLRWLWLASADRQNQDKEEQ